MNKLPKRFLPFIILFFVTVIWIIFMPNPAKVLAGILIFIELIGIPLTVLSLQRKEPWQVQLSAIIGFLIGAAGGFYLGAKIVDFIMTLIYGDMSRYTIRIDVLAGALLGASIFSSIGAIVGGRISRRRKEKRAAEHKHTSACPRTGF